jgi:anti-sigma regulatory factor (Ser/Thr protein kinase)
MVAPPPEHEQRLTLRNDPAELVRLSDAVRRFCAGHGLDDDMTYRATLALEETVTNVINYAYADAAAHVIDVTLALCCGELMLQVSDAGRPFNPLEAEPPDLDAPIEERGIGGLGIHLVRQFMDRVNYARRGDRNVLTMYAAVVPSHRGATGASRT